MQTLYIPAGHTHTCTRCSLYTPTPASTINQCFPAAQRCQDSRRSLPVDPRPEVIAASVRQEQSAGQTGGRKPRLRPFLPGETSEVRSLPDNKASITGSGLAFIWNGALALIIRRHKKLHRQKLKCLLQRELQQRPCFHAFRFIFLTLLRARAGLFAPPRSRRCLERPRRDRRRGGSFCCWLRPNYRRALKGCA